MLDIYPLSGDSWCTQSSLGGHFRKPRCGSYHTRCHICVHSPPFSVWSTSTSIRGLGFSRNTMRVEQFLVAEQAATLQIATEHANIKLMACGVSPCLHFNMFEAMLGRDHNFWVSPGSIGSWLGVCSGVCAQILHLLLERTLRIPALLVFCMLSQFLMA